LVQLSISLHLFPDDWGNDGSGGPNNSALYPELRQTETNKRGMLALKRTVDVLGSLFLLLLFLPLLVVIAAAVKLTSKGPVFFRQQRVGQYGQCFTFLKFRSMRNRNDHSQHMQYVKQMIEGNANRVSAKGEGEGVYKLVNDPRITPLGKFLRRTSLDELPQFLNVLWGDMSLVGPRPPIPYEVAAYQTWHRRRVLDVKPGITGLWQVTGRSRVSFDDMVRLDLHYANFWSLWLDVKILMRTPGAVIKGAY
jgi:lipopolysaccharide/colanic/teichoic acid biosynthesis glycosyltransferase